MLSDDDFERFKVDNLPTTKPGTAPQTPSAITRRRAKCTEKQQQPSRATGNEGEMKPETLIYEQASNSTQRANTRSKRTNRTTETATARARARHAASTRACYAKCPNSYVVVIASPLAATQAIRSSALLQWCHIAYSPERLNQCRDTRTRIAGRLLRGLHKPSFICEVRETRKRAQSVISTIKSGSRRTSRSRNARRRRRNQPTTNARCRMTLRAIWVYSPLLGYGRSWKLALSASF